MKKVKQINTIVLLHQLWIKEEEEPNTVISEVALSGAGTHVVFQAVMNTPYITLISKEYGWLSEDNMNDLKILYNQLGATFDITYSDDTTDTVRVAHEKGIVFTPIYEGACYFSVTINLAKVL